MRSLHKNTAREAAVGCWLVVGLLVAASAGAEDGHPYAALSVDAIGMTVSDLDRSVDFYSRVLSFEKQSETEILGESYEHLLGVFGLRARVARLRLGDETIELTEFLTPRGQTAPRESQSNDRWFQHIAIITGDMDRAYAWLRQHRVEHVSPGPQRLPDWNQSAGGIRAFYFRDPDGHPLEILQFPAGKGAARWHQATDRLFLGIDHTAIVVGDTERSLAFYRDLLGFTVAGASENYGPEQERLNLVFGARLRITGLRLPQGPAIEFLEYLTPRDGRPMPLDEDPSDLYHWQTTIEARGLEDLAGAALSGLGAESHFISPGPVTLPEGELGFRRGMLLRDPDGHVLQWIER